MDLSSSSESEPRSQARSPVPDVLSPSFPARRSVLVTGVQPASINSGSAEKLAARTEATIASFLPEGRRRYGDQLRGLAKVMLKQETAGRPPDVVAQAVLDVLRAKTPPARLPAAVSAG